MAACVSTKLPSVSILPGIHLLKCSPVTARAEECGGDQVPRAPPRSLLQCAEQSFYKSGALNISPHQHPRSRSRGFYYSLKLCNIMWCRYYEDGYKKQKNVACLLHNFILSKSSGVLLSLISKGCNQWVCILIERKTRNIKWDRDGCKKAGKYIFNLSPVIGFLRRNFR